jgi:hypothetical protein
VRARQDSNIREILTPRDHTERGIARLRGEIDPQRRDHHRITPVVAEELLFVIEKADLAAALREQQRGHGSAEPDLQQDCDKQAGSAGCRPVRVLSPHALREGQRSHTAQSETAFRYFVRR